jgi:hypothetical protein
MERYENCYKEDLVMHGGLETYVSEGNDARHGSVAFLLGGGPQDSASNRLLAKKLKKGVWTEGAAWSTTFSA